MATNSYVRWWTDTNEQNLLQGLMTEAIKFHGFDLVYMPRSMRREDTLYNEDILSKFTSTYSIEAYLKNVTGWDGQGNFLSKFGLRVDDKMTLMISRERFDEIIPRARLTTGQISAEAGGVVITGNNTKFRSELKVGDTIITSRSGQSRTIVSIESNTKLTVNTPYASAVEAEYFSIPVATPTVLPTDRSILPPSRPMEGDLIYFPEPLNVMMEVKYVQHEKASGQFYPLGKLTFYEVECEIFTYNHEVIETGDPSIDVYAQTYEYQQDLFLVQESGSGVYEVGEHVYQGRNLADSTASADVVSWDADNRILRIGNIKGEFAPATLVVGYASQASYYLEEAPNTMLMPNTKAADNTYLDEQDNDIIDNREIHRIVGGV